LFFVYGCDGPDIGFAIFTPTYNIPPIIAKGCMDLTAGVLIPAKFNLQVPITEVVESDAGIIAGDEKLDFPIRIAWW
jgi:hypothetical protein